VAAILTFPLPDIEEEDEEENGTEDEMADEASEAADAKNNLSL
jgi:hypothetical protein